MSSSSSVLRVATGVPELPRVSVTLGAARREAEASGGGEGVSGHGMVQWFKAVAGEVHTGH